MTFLSASMTFLSASMPFLSASMTFLSASMTFLSATFYSLRFEESYGAAVSSIRNEQRSLFGKKAITLSLEP